MAIAVFTSVIFNIANYRNLSINIIDYLDMLIYTFR